MGGELDDERLQRGVLASVVAPPTCEHRHHTNQKNFARLRRKGWTSEGMAWTRQTMPSSISSYEWRVAAAPSSSFPWEEAAELDRSSFPVVFLSKWMHASTARVTKLACLHGSRSIGQILQNLLHMAVLHNRFTTSFGLFVLRH